MIRNAVIGLEKLLDAEIPQDSLILISGAEGTLKSALVFSMISHHLESQGGNALYITVDQSKESQLQNMSSLGLKRPDGLHIFDYRDLRREWMDQEIDIFQVTYEVIDHYRDKHEDLALFALDPLNSLYSLSSCQDLRKTVYGLFSRLRDYGLASFLVLESAINRPAGYMGLLPEQAEKFLADGTIELGIMETKGGVKRYIQIPKMRAVRHAMEKHQIIIDREGLKILGPVY